MGIVTALSGDRDVFDVTLALDTSIYASGDVLSGQIEVSGVFREGGHTRKLVSLHVLDEDDQGQPFDIVLLNSSDDFGTANAVLNVPDFVADNITGIVEIASGDYVDLVNSQTATKTGLDLMVKAASGTTSLWVAAISRGTGTYTASGIKLKLGFE